MTRATGARSPRWVAATGAPVAVHPEDAEPLPVTGFEPLVEGDEVIVGNCQLSVIQLVGHTPGRSPCSTQTATDPTCSPATRCSPAATA